MYRPSKTIWTHRRFICCGHGWHQMMSVCMFVWVGGERGVGHTSLNPPRGTSRPCQRVTWVMSDACFFSFPVQAGKVWVPRRARTHAKVLASVCVQGCVGFREHLSSVRLLADAAAAAAAGEGVSQWGESIDTTKVQIKNLLTVLWVPNGFPPVWSLWGAGREVYIHKYYKWLSHT